MEDHVYWKTGMGAWVLINARWYKLLATDANVGALADMNGVWIDKVHDRRPPKMIILDMDNSVSPTHGEQAGTAYNGHFEII